eukprot:5738687-Amphidinium_carterae.1
MTKDTQARCRVSRGVRGNVTAGSVRTKTQHRIRCRIGVMQEWGLLVVLAAVRHLQQPLHSIGIQTKHDQGERDKSRSRHKHYQ